MNRLVLVSMLAVLLVACSTPDRVNATRAQAPEDPVAPEALKEHEEDPNEPSYLKWPTTAAEQLAADKEKEAYIASRYSASAVAHSFGYGGGYIDCVDELQQPGNVPGQALATPPPPIPDAGTRNFLPEQC